MPIRTCLRLGGDHGPEPKPNDVADLIGFQVSTRAASITGSDYVIDGQLFRAPARRLGTSAKQNNRGGQQLGTTDAYHCDGHAH